MKKSNGELVGELKTRGVLYAAPIIEAFLSVDRKDFVRDEYKDLAYIDEALPIGAGQTISQPYTVAFMLELLSPKLGWKIIDAGAGSFWQTALLASIVGSPAGGGKVYAFERISELCDFGSKNISKYPELKKRIEILCKDASGGLSEEEIKKTGGVDGIIAAAELNEVPETWREQLKNGGRLVYPMGGAIFNERKISENKFQIEKYPGFAFVPFISE
ncbi:protein-L-isoaspartate O-methyltransferase [Candidatus Giovannonibacteria bacterium]|nr:protein-L-isoaspartate O-methyltransferase [Candidatus Giovannonibacteria bacterium]